MSEVVVVLVPVTLSLIVSLTVPNILLRSLNKQREIDKAEVQEHALTAARKVERKTDAVAEKLATTTEKTNEKLDIIHILVNSNLTKQMQATLAALKGQLALLEGSRESAARKATIVELKERIADLENTLRVRHDADVTVKKKITKKKITRKRKPRG